MLLFTRLLSYHAVVVVVTVIVGNYREFRRRNALGRFGWWLSGIGGKNAREAGVI